jgi:hypothetical protein
MAIASRSPSRWLAVQSIRKTSDRFSPSPSTLDPTQAQAIVFNKYWGGPGCSEEECPDESVIVRLAVLSFDVRANR